MIFGRPLFTERLILRQWRDEDRAPFAEMSADPETMAYYLEPWTRERSDAWIDRAQAAIAARGYGFWALERRSDGRFLGYTGIGPADYLPSFQGVTEVGWRLAKDVWGQGYASEAARDSLLLGFKEQGLSEIVAFTATINARSEGVMRRIGMVREPARDFDWPTFPEGHRLRPHIVYVASPPP